ncbi:4622_t:CDS:10 [Acaulospora morrowiae]|uniref:5'-3' exoribonuclease n=1 Tax=Acaulospora morrowiae TaxID=94023 RepID=A0A9N9C931_9GLOM|nr:4622_t:CDS:10 [Acaulospora morrowiae]
MGVPALFKWLSKKYPKIIEKVIEEIPVEINGVELPVDISKPNPNKVEYDNLYLDMNGIIHPCCNPDDKNAPATEQDMMVEIFKYIERIISIVRPRKILYLAIDGVAPRAKMNQQRSRRFRKARDDRCKLEEKSKEIDKREASGVSIDEELQKKGFDTNCITPGTPFMAYLAKCLRYWIADKLNSDPGWKNLKVILSDASVPGEGEHKVMDFIRAQRASPHHDPNTRHVLYGLDADLIMLSLGTHEPHFKVLREDVFFQEAFRACLICGQIGHQASQCQGHYAKSQSSSSNEKPSKKPYVFLNVETLREYLEIELKTNSQPWPFNIEGAIDDWIFLCFFVGNDFLPHLPSLEIREGAIDTLISIWKRCLPLMGGYMTNSGNVELKRVQYLVTELGKMEDDIFIRRHNNDQRRSTQQHASKRRKIKSDTQNDVLTNSSVLPHLPIGMPLLPVKGVDSELRSKSNQEVVENRQTLRMANLSAARKLKAEMDSSTSSNSAIVHDLASTETTIVSSESYQESTITSKEIHDEELSSLNSENRKRKSEHIDGSQVSSEVEGKGEEAEELPTSNQPDTTEDADVDDPIRLWEPGFKERYYKDKFDIDLPNERFCADLVKSYIEGLCWVLQYYFQGVPSWKWYYPYHYSPFSSDFVNIGDIQISFELGEPFKPFEQLMGVLPADSKDHLPEPCGKLMTDEDSEIIDFYPTDFRIDLNGKKYEWQGVALLPFIEELRLLKAISTVYPLLSPEEIFRNTLGAEILCFSNKHKLYDELCALYSKRKNDEPIPLNPTISDKLIGFVSRDPNCIPESTFYSPLPEKNLLDIVNDRSLSVQYYLPKKTSSNMHKSILLKNVKLDPPILGQEDYELIKYGRGRGRGRGYNNGPPRNHSNYNSRDLPGYQYTYYSNNYYENRDASRHNHYGKGGYPYNMNARGNSRGFGRGNSSNYHAYSGYSQNNHGDRYESQNRHNRDNER